jgi:dihydroorotase-like cyclic amidohydrolase
MSAARLKDIQAAAHTTGVDIHLLRASTDRELEVFPRIKQQRIAVTADSAC